MISVIDFEHLRFDSNEIWSSFYYDFYCVAIKKGASGKFRYGQGDYDFDEGVMSFTKPGQIFSVTNPTDEPVSGYMMVFKSDLVRHYELGKLINNYGFFSYSTAEALHLSEKEDNVIMSLMHQMQAELKNNIDHYSQDLIVSYVDLLLNYARRFHNRQFLTRGSVNNDIVAKMEKLMDAYLKSDATLSGVPTVNFFAEKLNVSPNYLSDLLKNATGRNAQTHIQEAIVERAKELLSTTNLSIKEIAYDLGFEYPQSFSTMFKKNTQQTPLQFRAAFN
ncbi:Helix-turn-helix domain-containing protein [Flagellimonas taeanensis]|uniref:Helix-turn-helix domain-containing protein n=1 Tax=Flagellimonas taeanensis TaxID=1005926 RepID=A0A1I1E6F9_9FLAO|nr:Helix-turn-helix domain-containing protein [Allomuricauda taeanensis]